MTDPEWTEAWLRAWRSFPGAGDANPWTAMLDHFSNDLSASYPQPLADALDRITEQSRAFFDLGQALAADGGEGRQDAVFRYLDGVAARLRDPEAASRAFGGVSPLVYWRQFAGDGGESPSDHQTLMSQLEQLMRMPGLGPTRERQESVRELSRLWLDYEHAYGEYAAYCAETARRSVERLRERLKEAFAAGGGPASVRALYDEWVACSEEVYAERTATSDYMRLHGRLVNALMAYRRQAAELLDQWAEAVNLPSRKEVDALHRKLKETRRALRALEARTAEPQQKKRKKKAAKKKAAKKKAAKKKAAKKKAAKKKRAGQQ